MAKLKYSNKHNMVAFLKKPNESFGFTEVVDFLKVRTLANGTQQLVASIDSKEYTITEASVRSKLQLADATGIHNLSDAEIYAGLATLGYVTEGDIVPLLPAMLAGAAVDQGEGSAQPAEPHHTPVDPILSTSQPPIPSPPHPSPPPHSPHQSPPHSPPYSSPHSPPFSPPRSYEAPLPEGNTFGSAEDSNAPKELWIIVPKLSWEDRIHDIDERSSSFSCKQKSMKMKLEVNRIYYSYKRYQGRLKSKRSFPANRGGRLNIVKGLDSEEEFKYWYSEEVRLGFGNDHHEPKLEENAELTKSLQGESMNGEDFTKRMVEMINQKKKFMQEQRLGKKKQALI
ncbi:hypothetical protein Tco_0261038 [Tanacetum coccineum]